MHNFEVSFAIVLNIEVFQLYSPIGELYCFAVIYPSDVICASRVEGYKANIISL